MNFLSGFLPLKQNVRLPVRKLHFPPSLTVLGLLSLLAPWWGFLIRLWVWVCRMYGGLRKPIRWNVAEICKTAKHNQKIRFWQRFLPIILSHLYRTERINQRLIPLMLEWTEVSGVKGWWLGSYLNSASDFTSSDEIETQLMWMRGWWFVNVLFLSSFLAAVVFFPE